MEGSFVSAVVLLLLVCDPLGNVPIVVSALREVPPERRRRVILRECLIAFAVLALALWVFVDRFTATTVDYYRFWGGSQRRIGKPEVAEYAYRRLTEIDPDSEAGHFQLGRLLIKRGAVDEGIRELREAQRVAPHAARSFVEEARVLQTQGKTAAAIEKAKQATFADPSHAQARALLDTLTGKKPAKLPDDDDSND